MLRTEYQIITTLLFKGNASILLRQILFEKTLHVYRGLGEETHWARRYLKSK